MRIFRTAASWFAAMHVIAGIGAVTLLPGGNEGVPDVRDRVAYMARIGNLWPVAIAAVGLGCDGSGESIFIGWIPRPQLPWRARMVSMDHDHHRSDTSVMLTNALLMLFFIPWVVIAGKKMP